MVVFPVLMLSKGFYLALPGFIRNYIKSHIKMGTDPGEFFFFI